MFELLVDWPAREVAGFAWIAWIFGSLAAAVWLGVRVADLLHPWLHRYLANAIGVVVWIYASLVLYRAEYYLAIGVLHSQRG